MLSSSSIIIFLVFLTTLILFYILAFRVKWRKIWIFLLTPLAHKIPAFIMPNHITLAGLFFPLGAFLFIYLAKFNYFFFLWAYLFIFAYALTDSLDGILASLRHQITKRGAFLDYTLDKIVYLFLLFALMLGGHVRAELIVLVMLFTLFYSLLNMESRALTGSFFTLADRPQGLTLALILCFAIFLLKFFRADVITFSGRNIQSLDVIFVIMPIYQFALILSRGISLWKELKIIDKRESGAD